MKTSSSTYHHVILLSLFLLLTVQATAQPIRDPGTRDGTNLYPPYSGGYSRFSSSLAIIIAVLVTSIFFMVFFFVYIRYCTAASSSSVRPPVVVRATAAVRGLDAAVIDTFPTFTYSEVKDHKIGKEALECAVCLNEFEDDETLRLLPKCDHVFHPECIDAWLKSHVTCPVCRADLVPRPGDRPMQVAGPTGINEEGSDSEANVEMGNLANNDVVIQIDAEINRLERPKMNRNLSFQSLNKSTKAMDRNLSFGNPNKPPRKMMNRNMTFANPGRMLRSLTMRPRTFGRSRSAGNLLVQPGEDLERFTLRLPTNVRRDMIKRAALNRTKSFATTLADGSNRGDKIGKSDREVKSDRWDFFTRAWSFSLISPRGVVERGESSGTASTATASRSLNKLRSFNCLEPRAADETGLMMEEPVKPSV